jgi:hypothetical protein
VSEIGDGQPSGVDAGTAHDAGNEQPPKTERSPESDGVPVSPDNTSQRVGWKFYRPDLLSISTAVLALATIMLAIATYGLYKSTNTLANNEEQRENDEWHRETIFAVDRIVQAIDTLPSTTACERYLLNLKNTPTTPNSKSSMKNSGSDLLSDVVTGDLPPASLLVDNDDLHSCIAGLSKQNPSLASFDTLDYRTKYYFVRSQTIGFQNILETWSRLLSQPRLPKEDFDILFEEFSYLLGDTDKEFIRALVRLDAKEKPIDEAFAASDLNICKPMGSKSDKHLLDCVRETHEK